MAFGARLGEAADQLLTVLCPFDNVVIVERSRKICNRQIPAASLKLAIKVIPHNFQDMQYICFKFNFLGKKNGKYALYYTI